MLDIDQFTGVEAQFLRTLFEAADDRLVKLRCSRGIVNLSRLIVILIKNKSVTF